MQKIDKDYTKILTINYKKWVDALEAMGKKHPLSKTYYDGIVMDLYRCQKGVCAYTERFLCPPSLYEARHWTDKGVYQIEDPEEFTRTDHAGELEHFDPTLKENQYWLWDNLFMIDARVNGLKSDTSVVAYLKPDSLEYTTEQWLDYDEQTHRFVPNTELDEEKAKEVQYMIDHVFYLNHGVIRIDRQEYVEKIKMKKTFLQPYKIDRYFTAIKVCLEDI